MTVNKAILIGYLGSDPETRFMPDGSAVANVSIATSERWKDKTGEQKEKTEWHRLVFFGKLADLASQYLAKGSRIYVEGKIQTRKWQDKSGKDCYTTEIVVGLMQMLDSKAESKPAPQPQKPVPQKPALNQQDPFGDMGDDIPF